MLGCRAGEPGLNWVCAYMIYVAYTQKVEGEDDDLLCSWSQSSLLACYNALDHCRHADTIREMSDYNIRGGSCIALKIQSGYLFYSCNLGFYVWTCKWFCFKKRFATCLCAKISILLLFVAD